MITIYFFLNFIPKTLYIKNNHYLKFFVGTPPIPRMSHVLRKFVTKYVDKSLFKHALLIIYSKMNQVNKKE